MTACASESKVDRRTEILRSNNEEREVSVDRSSSSERLSNSNSREVLGQIDEYARTFTSRWEW